MHITAHGSPVSEMNYTVSSGTLNSTIPYRKNNWLCFDEFLICSITCTVAELHRLKTCGFWPPSTDLFISFASKTGAETLHFGSGSCVPSGDWPSLKLDKASCTRLRRQYSYTLTATWAPWIDSLDGMQWSDLAEPLSCLISKHIMWTAARYKNVLAHLYGQRNMPLEWPTYTRRVTSDGITAPSCMYRPTFRFISTYYINLFFFFLFIIFLAPSSLNSNLFLSHNIFCIYF